MNIFSEMDAEPSLLEGKKIIVGGYGNQGRPQALNLRDSGFDVGVAARRGGRGRELAESDGFRTLRFSEAAARADVLILLVPDEKQGEVFRDEISGNLRPGAALCFAHGFSVAFGEIETDEYDLLLVAPKGQGERLRSAYLEGSGLPCFLAVECDASGKGREIALAIAHGLGCLRVGAFETSFREEAVSDLFGEQAILCGGVPALIKCAFDVLVHRGFSPEVAYFECFHELKIIVDLLNRLGFAGMRDVISGTAAYGSLLYGEKVIVEGVGAAMNRLFDRIDSGEFARNWLEEARSGGRVFKELIEEERNLGIEEVGERIRRMIARDAE